MRFPSKNSHPANLNHPIWLLYTLETFSCTSTPTAQGKRTLRQYPRQWKLLPAAMNSMSFQQEIAGIDHGCLRCIAYTYMCRPYHSYCILPLIIPIHIRIIFCTHEFFWNHIWYGITISFLNQAHVGHRVASSFLMAYRGIYSAHACSVSKSHNPNILISSETHIMWRGSIKALVVRCQYGLINTLGLYVNTLEYIELLNGLIFGRAYGSQILFSVLCTLIFVIAYWPWLCLGLG